MASAARPWVFTQLGGPKKKMILQGWSAPFGRPRKGPVVEDGLELRDNEIYYDGNDEPTRQIFGTKNKDWEIHGRWMDKVIGASNGANVLVEQWKRFLADGQMCTIEWGDVIAGRGILHEFVPSRESTAEIDWKMTWRISSDTTKSLTVQRPAATLPGDMASNLSALLSGPLGVPKLNPAIEMNVSFLESIDDALSSVNAGLGGFLNAANAISNLEQATFNELSRFRASINQIRTALIVLQRTWDAVPNDAAMARDASLSTLAWMTFRSNAQVSIYAALAALADNDDQAEAAQRGRASTTYRVKMGDTWESISAVVYGSSSNADVLRQANAARYGSKPQPGRSVQVPLTI